MSRSPHMRAIFSAPLLLIALVALSLGLTLAPSAPLTPAAHAADGKAPAASPQQRTTAWISGWRSAPRTVKAGQRYVAQVRISGGRRPLDLQRRVGGRWQTVATSRSSSTGRATLSWTPRSAGRVPLRIAVPRAGRHDGLLTRARFVTVRRVPVAQPTVSPLLQSVLVLLNTARAAGQSCGGTWYPAVPALRLNAKLNTAAYRHSQAMATNDFFSHSSLNGDSPGDRIEDAGYHWMSYGENIAAGQRTAADVVEDLLESPGHCKNIMGRYDEVGLGYVFDADSTYGAYWTQDFATR